MTTARFLVKYGAVTATALTAWHVTHGAALLLIGVVATIAVVGWALLQFIP